jgi:RNA polymerase sigma-70 factor, ECF subfamily
MILEDSRPESPGRSMVGPSRPPLPLVSTADGSTIDALVARAADGDSDAFAALYDEFAPRLYRYVAFRVREPSDAEDLVQRVFVKLIEALPRYEQRGVPFSAWLFRLAHNATIDFARTGRDHRPLEAVADRPADTPDPADVAASSADAAVLEAAIRTLTEDQQQVIACRFFGGLSTAETARVLGRREVAVRALQFRALGALRRRLLEAQEIETLTTGERAP